MSYIRIAAFSTAADAERARDALEHDPSTVDMGDVYVRPDHAELAPARRRERPFVRLRGRRAMIFGGVTGFVIATALFLVLLAFGFNRGLGGVALGLAALGLVFGGLTGWVLGTARIQQAYHRLTRVAPRARAFLAARVHSASELSRFDHVCSGRGAIATIGA